MQAALRLADDQQAIEQLDAVLRSEESGFDHAVVPSTGHFPERKTGSFHLFERYGTVGPGSTYPIRNVVSRSLTRSGRVRCCEQKNTDLHRTLPRVDRRSLCSD